MRRTAALGLMRGAVVLGAFFCGAAAKLTCKTTQNVDYNGRTSGSSRENVPADSQEACCAACVAHPGCVVGVWSPPIPGGDCWFKDAADYKNPEPPKRGKTCVACMPVDDGGPESDMGFGEVFAVGFGGVCVLYLVAGFAVGLSRERKLRHAHAARWDQMYGLVADGLRFVTGRGAGYDKVAGIGGTVNEPRAGANGVYVEPRLPSGFAPAPRQSSEYGGVGQGFAGLGLGDGDDDDGPDPVAKSAPAPHRGKRDSKSRGREKRKEKKKKTPRDKGRAPAAKTISPGKSSQAVF